MEVCYMKLCHRLCLQLFGCCLMQKSMLMLAPRYLSADTVANMMYFVDLVSEKCGHCKWWCSHLFGSGWLSLILCCSVLTIGLATACHWEENRPAWSILVGTAVMGTRPSKPRPRLWPTRPRHLPVDPRWNRGILGTRQDQGEVMGCFEAKTNIMQNAEFLHTSKLDTEQSFKVY